MFRFARRWIGAGCLAILLFGQGVGIGAIQTWSDGDFGGWSFSSIASSGSSASTTIAGECNPGSGLNCTTKTGETAWAICINPGTTWYPSQRLIESVSMSIDVKSIAGWGQGQAIRLVVQQNGKTFFAPSFSETCVTGPQTSWHRITVRSCLQNDFYLLLGPQNQYSNTHPDFSQTGSPVQFGFMLGNRISGTYTQLYDNWSLQLIHGPALIPFRHIIPGVPHYRQKLTTTCGPTSAGMILGYWDRNFPNLVPGSADTQTPEVDGMIDTIALFAKTGTEGTNQLQLIKATELYSMSRGYLSLIGTPFVYEDVALRNNLEGQRPAMMFTQTPDPVLPQDHMVVIDGYAGLLNPDTGDIAITDIRINDPGGGLYWDQGGNDPAYNQLSWEDHHQWRYPVRSLILYYPELLNVGAQLSILLGGAFNSQDDLDMFTVSGDGTAQLTPQSPIPLPDQDKRLVITTANEPMIISQEGMFASGQGFDLSFDYAMASQGVLDVLLDGVSVWTLQEAPPPGSGTIEHFVDTPSMGLDPQVKHRLTLKLTGPSGTVLWLDNLTATLRPYPDPLDKADLDKNGWIDLADLAILAPHWSESGCVDPDFCGGADLTGDGQVGLEDLLLFSEAWLTSAGQL
jgi:hypothetical protein